jgi:hypothetical protein
MLYVTSSWVRGGILSVKFLSEPASNDLKTKQESQPFLNQSSQLSRLLEHHSHTNPISMMSSNQILQMQRLQRERMQQQAHILVLQQPAFFLLPGQQPQQPMIQPPLTVDMNPILEQTVLAIQREYTSDNFNNIYDNKTKGWRLAAGGC